MSAISNTNSLITIGFRDAEQIHQTQTDQKTIAAFRRQWLGLGNDRELLGLIQ